MVKRLLLLLAALVAGTAVGAGAALAIGMLKPASPANGSPPVAAPDEDDDEPPQFVPVTVLAPLVFADGQLAGYANFKLQLRVASDEADLVEARVPLLLHAVNLQTHRVPLAAGVDGRRPELERFRALVQRSAEQVFGAGTVRHVAIVEARTT